MWRMLYLHFLLLLVHSEPLLPLHDKSQPLLGSLLLLEDPGLPLQLLHLGLGVGQGGHAGRLTIEAVSQVGLELAQTEKGNLFVNFVIR